jgi:hypothetical protein
MRVGLVNPPGVMRINRLSFGTEAPGPIQPSVSWTGGDPARDISLLYEDGERPQAYVITNPAELRPLWAILKPNEPLPAINFARDSVILVLLDEKATAFKGLAFSAGVSTLQFQHPWIPDVSPERQYPWFLAAFPKEKVQEPTVNIY